ncbi:MAG: hypothetical protein NXI31_10335 [bacterium]|nr:hypothetical protein [bacterium]
MISNRIAAALLLSTALTSTLSADLVAQSPRHVRHVLPVGYATVEGSSFVGGPFGRLPTRWMGMYGPSTLGVDHPVRILGVRYRPDGAVNSTTAGNYQFTLDLSTSARTTATWRRRFDDNHGADRTRVFSGTIQRPPASSVGSPSPFALSVFFHQPFEWDPACGPLVFDYNMTAGSRIASTFDFVNATAGPDAVSFHGAANSATSEVTDLGALVVELVLDTETAPGDLLANAGSTGNFLPWGSPDTSYRVQDIHGAVALGFDGRTRIHSLAWRVDESATFVGASYDCRITMSTTSTVPGSPSLTFASNHGVDEKVVFDGHLTAPAVTGPTSSGARPFELVCPLDEAFEYNPALGNLVVDVQVRSHNTPSTTRWDSVAVAAEPVGRVYASGGPGTWSLPTATTVGQNVHVLGIVGEPMPTLPATDDDRLGNDSLVAPFSRSSARSMFLYPPSAVATSRPIWIEHLAFRPNGVNGDFEPATWACTIDLSESAVATGPLSNTFDANHGARRTRVFDGKFSVPFLAGGRSPAEFPIVVKLDSAFYWDPGSGPLVLDIRVTDRVGSNSRFDSRNNGGMFRISANDANATTATANNSNVLVVRLGGYGAGNPLAEEYGSGCAGSNGLPRCYTDALPRLPSSGLELLLVDGPAISAAFVMLGLTEASVPLDSFGLPGCTGLNNRELGSILTFTSPFGEGALALPLPDAPELVGVALQQQWAGVDPAANATGISFSNGQRLVLSR